MVVRRGRPPKTAASSPARPLARLNPWSPKTIKAFRAAFEDFLSYLRIDSKEGGGECPLILNGAQQRFLDEVFDGLAHGIHNFVVLKARQLGITTISVALDLFWQFYFPGTKGALAFDKDETRDEFRVTLSRYIESLPMSHRVDVPQHNRIGMTLGNGSRFSYLVAGSKKSVKSGSLGRGLGMSFVHATEVSSWGDPEGIASLKAALAQKNPNRLYIWESTARGYNDFSEMWEDAKVDTLTQRAIFIGWWAKEDYAYSSTEPTEAALFEKYSYPLNAKEEKTAATVKELYHHEITIGQWAWYRHNKDPNISSEDQISTDTEKSALFEQEYPTTEEEAFLMTGSSYFSASLLTEAYKKAQAMPFKGFRYIMSNRFTDMQIEPVTRAIDAELRIWEEPDPEGVYVIGADPAYGSSDRADRYVAQVLRCYADGVDQVAEFCVVNLATYQFAWVLAHLAAVYRNARYLLEITGPGEAVWNEFRNLRTLIESGYLREDAEKAGLANIFANIRQYMYQRPDSMGSGLAWQFKTTGELKSKVYSAFRDAFYLEQLSIRSVECLKEMKRIKQEGITIEADGSAKDDRPMALALAVRCWNDWERKSMISANRTREIEIKKKTRTHDEEVNQFQAFILRSFLEDQAAQRGRAIADARRGNRWRH